MELVQFKVLMLCQLAKLVRGQRGHARLTRAVLEGLHGCRGFIVGMSSFFS